MKKSKATEGAGDDNSIIEGFLASIRQDHGSAMGISPLEEEFGDNIASTSTGCLGLDYVLACGGLPEGRVIEIYGAESSGKTTLTLFIAAQLQKQGKRVAFFDVEQSFNIEWAKKIGVQFENYQMLVLQPSTVEETMTLIREITKINMYDLIIVDSLEAMIPAKELEEGALEKDTVGLKARLLSKYLRVLTAEAARTKTAIVFINQLRANIQSGFVAYGQPKEITPGGKALKFYASIRLEVKKGTAIKDKAGTQQIGNNMTITARKNKVGHPFRTTELELFYQTGVNLFKDTLKTAVKCDIITVDKRTYYYENTKLGTSEEAAVATLEADQELYQKVYDHVRRVIEGGNY